LEVEGARQTGRPRKTWKEVVDKDMDDLNIKMSDAMDRSKWKISRLRSDLYCVEWDVKL